MHGDMEPGDTMFVMLQTSFVRNGLVGRLHRQAMLPQCINWTRLFFIHRGECTFAPDCENDDQSVDIRSTYNTIATWH